MRAAIEKHGPNPCVLTMPDERTPHSTAVDWVGLPARVVECATRSRALDLLDSAGGRALQEEYVEWRTVRDGVGVRRVEITTEMGEYWRVLAAHEPERLLDLVAEFSRQEDIRPDEVFGGLNPLDPSSTPEEREQAFASAMLATDDPNPYNDGRLAICCLSRSANTLRALAGMIAASTRILLTKDDVTDRVRCLTSAEAIPLLGDAGQVGRASDPVLIERLMRLAYERRLVALDDPVGVYVHSVEHSRLRTPDGGATPSDWFAFSRGSPPDETADGKPRWQRVCLEVPAETGWTVGDLVDSATGQPIRYGGQIAEMVQVAVIFRVSDPHAAAVDEPTLMQLDGVAELQCVDVVDLTEQVDSDHSDAL